MRAAVRGAPRPQRRLTLAAVALALVSTAACSAAPNTGKADPGDIVVEPVQVPGLEPCAVLEQRADGDDGQRLPDVTLPCLNQSRTVDLPSLGGKPTVINLWASWCGPCREEMPRLAEAAKQAPAVQFVGVNTRDDPEFAGAFLEATDVTYPQVVDVDGLVLESTRVPGLPVTLAVNAEGVIVDRVIGEVSDDELQALLASLAG